jgi:uncharacterized protein YjbI with pentapeptide repeats
MTKDEFFPLSNHPGSLTALNNELMHQMSETSAPIDSASFETMLKDHHIFLESAGREGKWQTLEVAGLTMAIYTGGSSANGKQASFLNCNLSLLQFNELDLACADFVNVFYKNGSFRNANLKNSIFIDSVLIGTDFSGADLSGCDFSRALMMNCQFSNVNLSSCDFENCNLSNSSFIGATTTGSRFPGAILENVIF